MGQALSGPRRRNAPPAAGGDPQFANVQLLAFNENANGGSVFTDQSQLAQTLTNSGDGVWSSSAPPSGLSWAYSADGSNDFVQVPDHASLELGSGDWTIEFTYKRTGTSGILLKGDTNSDAWKFSDDSDSTIFFFASSNGAAWDIVSVALVGAHTAGAWAHVALSRLGNTCYPAIDGVVGASFGFVGTIFNGTTTLLLGSAGGTNTATNLASLRITVGVVRTGYTANFTPPSLPLPTS